MLQTVCNQALAITSNSSETRIIVDERGGGLGHKFISTEIAVTYALLTKKQVFCCPMDCSVMDSCHPSCHLRHYGFLLSQPWIQRMFPFYPLFTHSSGSLSCLRQPTEQLFQGGERHCGYGVRIKFLGGPRGFIDKKRSYFGIGTSLIPQIGSIRFLLKCSFDWYGLRTCHWSRERDRMWNVQGGRVPVVDPHVASWWGGERLHSKCYFWKAREE